MNLKSFSWQPRQTYSWKDLLNQRSCILPLAIVGLVTVVNRCSGYNAIITYCAIFLHQAVPAVSEYWTATGVTLMQVCMCVGGWVGGDWCIPTMTTYP